MDRSLSPATSLERIGDRSGSDRASWLHHNSITDPFKTRLGQISHISQMTDDTPPTFTPALGRSDLTSQYDKVIAVMTRERRWRARLLSALCPQPAETIVDIGAGTGSMAILIKQAVPDARVVAIDPDPEVLAIAKAKAKSAEVEVEFINSMSTSTVDILGPGTSDKVISSLVLHQCSPEAKGSILANAFQLLRQGGRLLIADYGLQRTLLMDLLFRQVRALDGYENTRPNKGGEIPAMIAAAGFAQVEELNVTPTPTGSISLYSAWKHVEK